MKGNSPLGLLSATTTVNVLAEPAQIYRITPNIGVMNIQLSRLYRLTTKQQSMDDAGLTRAVGTENQSERLDGHPLGFPKRFEVAETKAR